MEQQEAKGRPHPGEPFTLTGRSGQTCGEIDHRLGQDMFGRWHMSGRDHRGSGSLQEGEVLAGWGDWQRQGWAGLSNPRVWREPSGGAVGSHRTGSAWGVLGPRRPEIIPAVTWGCGSGCLSVFLPLPLH